MTDLVPDVIVKVGGSDLTPDLFAKVQEVKVEDHLVHPDSFLIRINDPGLENIDSTVLEIGKEVEIAFEAPGESTPKTVFKGEITALEPDFVAGKETIVVRGFDFGHRLNRSKNTKTYQSMTYGNIASQVISGAGLSPGTVDDAGGQQEFVQQSSETDWDFLWRLAKRIGNEIVADGKQVHFRKAQQGAAEVSVEYGDTLFEFHPRVTGVQQVQQVEVRGWDPKSKAAIVAQKTAPQPKSTIGIQRSKIATAFQKEAKVLVADRAVTTQAEATALADSLASKYANSYVDAFGIAKGNPNIKAGVKIEIKGVGSRFGGKYVVSSSTHMYRGSKGYHTKFTISPGQPQGLVDLMSPASPRSWGDSVVIGVVTNNKDPDNMGRVRIKYPSLGDKTEGWWARVASNSSGKDRGVMMLPQPNEEVLVAFEHNDPRKPYILGSVWNAKDTPGNLVQTDGSYVLQSDKQIQMKAKDPISIKGDKTLTIETKGAHDVSSKAGHSLKAKTVDLSSDTSVSIKAGSTASIQASGSMTVKGNSVTVDGGPSLTLKGGSVTITGGSISIG